MYTAIAFIVVLACMILTAIIIILILLCAEIILVYTETNKFIIIVKGREFYMAIQGDKRIFETEWTNANGTVLKGIRTESIPMWERYLLYKPFGIRYIGNPFAFRVGVTALYYPDEIQHSTSSLHVNGNIIRRLDGMHTYELMFPRVEFALGLYVDLYFNLEVVATLPNVAWGKYGRFLDSLIQGISACVRQIAITTDFGTFVGNGLLSKVAAGDIVKESNKIRKDMSASCMDLNTGASQINLDVPVDTMSGHQILVIAYQDLEVTDPETKARIKQLELVAESALKVQESANQLIISRNAAMGKASVTEEELMSEARGLAKLLEVFGGDMKMLLASIAYKAQVDATEKLKATTVFFGQQGMMGGVVPTFSVGGTTDQARPATATVQPPTQQPTAT